MDSVLADLPAPGDGRRGWPWTEESRLPESFDASSAPKISIVTPNYNMGGFIERTIRSVLLQSYPKLEYIVMDGGSKDDSRDIIKRYAPWLTHWQSAPDKGQTDAINRGLERTTGEIWAYMNSDDVYLPGAFFQIASRWMRGEWGRRNPGRRLWIAGSARFVDGSGKQTHVWTPEPPPAEPWLWLLPWGAPQASSFWDRELLEEDGLFDESFNYVFDTEFGIRHLFQGHPPFLVPGEVYSERVVHEAAKSWDERPFRVEWERMVAQYEPALTAEGRAGWERCRKWLALADAVDEVGTLLKRGRIWTAGSRMSRLLARAPIKTLRTAATRMTGFSFSRRWR